MHRCCWHRAIRVTHRPCAGTGQILLGEIETVGDDQNPERTFLPAGSDNASHSSDTGRNFTGRQRCPTSPIKTIWTVRRVPEIGSGLAHPVLPPGLSSEECRWAAPVVQTKVSWTPDSGWADDNPQRNSRTGGTIKGNPAGFWRHMKPTPGNKDSITNASYLTDKPAGHYEPFTNSGTSAAQ